MDFFKTSHSKTLLIAHLILVCKYRKKLLKNDLDNYVKDLIRTICIDMNIEIIRIESDLDHLHLLIQYPPTYSITSIVRSLKSKTTYYMWRSSYTSLLEKHFWKEHTFWSDGYFASSIGNASLDTIKKYIEEQG